MDAQRIRNGVAWRARRARRIARQRRSALALAWEAGADVDHLVPSPVFVICSPRSGSTLLRSILDTHSKICAPHELHLNTMRVSTPRSYAKDAWSALGLSTDHLQNLLWDRALHRMLVMSGKRVIVDKTPQNVLIWQRISEFWPAARYIHLRRHPMAAIASMEQIHPDRGTDEHVAWMLRYAEHLDAARAALPGPTVRYEELTTDAERVVSGICHYLGVRWEPRMLNYREGTFTFGLGDWSDRIKSGSIQAAQPLPAETKVPDALRETVRQWGYS